MAVIKIILLVLLGLFLLLLLFVTLALFFPFSYSVKGKGDGSFHFRINVHWLFYFLNFTIRLSVGGEKKPPKGALRILGIPILRIPKKKKKPKKKAKTEEPEETQEEEKPAEPVSEEKTEETGGPDKAGKAEKPDDSDAEGEDTGASKKPGKLSKVKEILQELKDERNKAAVKKILGEGKKLLKLIFPKKLRMNLVFSTGDPANTGKVLGAACLFPPMYARGNHLYPDFEAEKAYAAGTFSVKGYIILITLVIPAVKILLDKNVRRIIGKIRKKA